MQFQVLLCFCLCLSLLLPLSPQLAWPAESLFAQNHVVNRYFFTVGLFSCRFNCLKLHHYQLDSTVGLIYFASAAGLERPGGNCLLFCARMQRRMRKVCKRGERSQWGETLTFLVQDTKNRQSRRCPLLTPIKASVRPSVCLCVRQLRRASLRSPSAASPPPPSCGI